MTARNERNDDRLPTLIPIFRDRWFDRLRSPLVRKALVVLAGALIVASVALQWSGRDGVSTAGIPALLIVVVLNLTTRVMADAPSRELDERMVATRNAAFRVAYHLFAVAIVALLVLLLAANGDDTISIERTEVLAGSWAIAVAALFLPSAVLAWTEEVV